jgi:hypothetical protein
VRQVQGRNAHFPAELSGILVKQLEIAGAVDLVNDGRVVLERFGITAVPFTDFQQYIFELDDVAGLNAFGPDIDGSSEMVEAVPFGAYGSQRQFGSIPALAAIDLFSEKWLEYIKDLLIQRRNFPAGLGILGFGAAGDGNGKQEKKKVFHDNKRIPVEQQKECRTCLNY